MLDYNGMGNVSVIILMDNMVKLMLMIVILLVFKITLKCVVEVGEILFILHNHFPNKPKNLLNLTDILDVISIHQIEIYNIIKEIIFLLIPVNKNVLNKGMHMPPHNIMDNVSVITIMEHRDKLKKMIVLPHVMPCHNKCVEVLGEILYTKPLLIKLNKV